ncbi:MAG: AraC family transcriptional regulator [Pseudomonadota bacterium]|nr:AraC family transcriptional regulator [Pseudomonadota bacterium]
MASERLYLRLEGDPVHGPESTVPAAALKAIAVPVPLRPRIANVIAYDEALPADTDVHERVLPDGALRLIVDLVQGRARIAGPSVQPVLLALRGQQHGLSITLRPGASLALFGIPAHALADRVVDWELLVAARHRSLPRRWQEAHGETTPARLVLSTLQGLMCPADPLPLGQALQAAALLRTTASPPPRIADVAAAVGLGERRLQQVFRAQFGLSPRSWRRLARLHACLLRLRGAGAPRWSELALESGFYDQAHLVREFQALCGLTPGQFLVRRGISESSKTSA